jgi:hypothetical protein
MLLHKMSYEARLRLAVQACRGENEKIGIGKCLSAYAAADEYEVCRQTVWRRHTGRTRPRDAAHVRQFLLTVEQEEVLVEWCENLSRGAHPLCRKTLAPKVKALCRREPGKN